MNTYQNGTAMEKQYIVYKIEFNLIVHETHYSSVAIDDVFAMRKLRI